ncbi:hypothetical protein [Arhodomonas sp. AD133]|uniref:hypothetical protein n=1 Tax=Arhodomonas sp. AD133 TaxID=3415009 RepID=UPI003EBC1B77
MQARDDQIRTCVRYRDGYIVLTGEWPALQLEAERILLRFRYSARPYYRRRVSEHHVVLAPCH